MIQMISRMYEDIMAMSRDSPVMAGLISVWGLSALTYLFRNIPSKIYKLVKRQLTTTLEFDNAQGYDHLEIYNSCMAWFYKTKGNTKFSRVFNIVTRNKWSEETGGSVEVSLGPGYGTHYFRYRGRFMWLTMSSLESSGSEMQKRKIEISYLGRNKSFLEKFIEDIRPPREENLLYTYGFDGNSWVSESVMRPRPMESIAMSTEIKDSILNSITHFYDNKEWFVKAGLPYKLTYILHGPPGTGKTSLIKALASEYKKNLCILEAAQLTDRGFQRSIVTVPRNSFIVIEDFDSIRSTQSRLMESPVDSESKSKGMEEMFSSSISLSGILNGLDGLRSLEDTIIFMTTNHIDKVDPAVYRKGRVDEIIEVGTVEDKYVREYINHIFPDLDASSVKETLGCNLNSALLQSKGDQNEFLKVLNELNDSVTN